MKAKGFIPGYIRHRVCFNFIKGISYIGVVQSKESKAASKLAFANNFLNPFNRYIFILFNFRPLKEWNLKEKIRYAKLVKIEKT